LKVLLVNLLAVLNFANVFKNKKRLENKKTLKNVKNVTKIKKHLCPIGQQKQSIRPLDATNSTQ